MIRTILALSFVALGILLVLPWFLLWSILTRNPNAMYRFSMRAMLIAAWIAGIRMRVEGLSNIPAGVCVFASNHVSNLDPLVLLPAIPRRVSILIKKELMRIPILAAGMRAAHFVVVDRENRRAAAASMNLSIRYLHEGLSFVVFAEGTRSPDGRMRPFKRGALLMAIQAEVPIVPVSIGGTQNLMRKGRMRVDAGEVSVCFGLPIDPSQFSSGQRVDFLAELESRVAANLPPEQRPRSL
jgi:1-acyl-sn-glycerol-3-phosphate acyltransferase